MINHRLITLLIMVSLIVGGCTVIPSDQQSKVDETPGRPEISLENQIIYKSKDKFWVMDENGQNQQVIWNCPAPFECENLSPDWKRGVYLEQGEQSWNVRLREQEKKEGRILMADVPQDKDFASRWSPNSRDLAVLFYSVVEGEQKNNELYIVNVETGEVKLLDTGISNSTWSPDGQQIVYYDFRPQGSGWYIMDLKTENRTKIIDSSLVQDRETWSPDSKKLALTITSLEVDVPTSKYVKNLETGTLTNIQDPDQYNYRLATNPTWSPDGSKIAYIADYRDPEDISHFRTLFIHDVGSGKQTPLVEQVWCGRLIWSPDSQKIIYESHQDRDHYIIDINTKQVTKILDGDEGYVVAWE